MKITFKKFMALQVEAILSSGLLAAEWVALNSKAFRARFIIED